MIKRTDYLTRTYGKPEGHSLGAYERSLGGYEVARRVLTTMTREQVVEEAKKANLRGRGGAGFPMGVKWSFMPKAVGAKPHYLVVNADEGEPGTHKDRTLMELSPHSTVEGCIIASYAIGAHICGEETSMLNSLEGRRGEPRMKPPFPANAGAFGCPTTVNNLETIAAVPTAFGMGCEEFSKLSNLHDMKDGGVRLYGVNGQVKTPGVVELAVGPTLNELVYEIGGGVQGDRKVLAVIPGGSSTPVL